MGTQTSYAYHSETSSELSVKICDLTKSRCCETPLKNGKQPFKYGKYDYFEKNYLGDCNGFSLPKTHFYEVTITTKGDDGWLGESFDIFAISKAGTNEVLTCPIDRWLDDKESMTLSCKWKGNITDFLKSMIWSIMLNSNYYF